jgi:hypothetical protein
MAMSKARQVSTEVPDAEVLLEVAGIAPTPADAKLGEGPFLYLKLATKK